MEQAIMMNIGKFSNQSLREIAQGFVFSQRGSKMLLQILQPRFKAMLTEFTTNELCYLLFSYAEVGYVPKQFAQEIE